jgi:hypothetical protein
MKKSAGRQPLYEVRHSPIHGYGVFALRKIRKGTTITEYLGERVSHEEADSRYEHKDPNDNHGCDPNCESTTLKKRIFVEAVRTIQPGEELAYDYQIERDPDDPPNVDEIFACRCGAAKCRGSMLVPRKEPRKTKAAKPSKSTTRGKKAAAKSTRTAAKKTAREAVREAAKKSAKKSGGAARKTSRASAGKRRGATR